MMAVWVIYAPTYQKRGKPHILNCQNPDLPDFRISRIIKNNVEKSGKSFK
jgi:hypothetical protein